MVERTLSIIKPDAVSKNIIGEIIRRFEDAQMQVVALQMRRLTKKEAESFYYVHRGKAFFESLASFMCSGPIVALVLEGDQAISKNRSLMGATDPNKAEKGTIRADFGSGIEANIVHGSDSKDSAAFEIPFFFSQLDILR